MPTATAKSGKTTRSRSSSPSSSAARSSHASRSRSTTSRSTNSTSRSSSRPATKSSSSHSNTSTTRNTGMAVIAYLIFFVPLLTDAKDDRFVKFHVKQSLGLIVFYIACAIIAIVPLLGWLVGGLGYLVGFVLWIIGIVNAASGQEKELPLIGQLANDKLNF